MRNGILKRVFLHRRKEGFKDDYIYYCFDSDQSLYGYTLITIKWVTFEIEEEHNLLEKEILSYKLKIKSIK